MANVDSTGPEIKAKHPMTAQCALWAVSDGHIGLVSAVLATTPDCVSHAQLVLVIAQQNASVEVVEFNHPFQPSGSQNGATAALAHEK